jgi:hypothetical protein
MICFFKSPLWALKTTSSESYSLKCRELLLKRQKPKKIRQHELARTFTAKSRDVSRYFKLTFYPKLWIPGHAWYTTKQVCCGFSSYSSVLVCITRYPKRSLTWLGRSDSAYKRKITLTCTILHSAAVKSSGSNEGQKIIAILHWAILGTGNYLRNESSYRTRYKSVCTVHLQCASFRLIFLIKY